MMKACLCGRASDRGVHAKSIGLLVASVFGAAVSTILAAQDASAQLAAPEVYVRGQSGGAVAADGDRMLAAAQARGRIPVIVKMRGVFQPEGEMSTFAVANQRTAIRSAQESILGHVSNVQNLKRFETVPMVAMSVDAAGVQALLNDPGVAAVYEDIPERPTLDDSVPLIRANKVSNKSKVKGGKGWVVAVLDTGVQRNHKAIKGKIVSEACYSTTNAGQNSTSVCPGGVAATTKRGSGINCDAAVDGCDHGTHVSGIAVGNPSGSPFKGVAPEASLFPIQVFSRFDDISFCGSSNPCVASFQSDQIMGLERVYKKRNKLKIASVNMSLGGSATHTMPCDADPRASIIANLKSNKTAVAIASGNNGSSTAISAPGCISDAITVGSTTKSDKISSFSNHNKLVDVLAPGSNITSAVLGNGFGVKSGTSMATPHVAGTWALLRAARPKASVNKIELALECTGKTLKRAKIKKPRIDVLAAFKALKHGCP